MLFFGHLHPLVVHLPIGMLMLLAVLEVAAWIPRFKNANASAGFIVALAAPLAVIAVVCGWLLSLEGGYDETLLAWHKWLGIGTAAGSVAAGILYWRKQFNSYRAVLIVTAALLAGAGHFGGSLTHGPDYLTRHAPEPLRKWLGSPAGNTPAKPTSFKDPQQFSVFEAVVQPIFENRCVMCHGPAKSKGDLRLDSFAGLMKGSEDGPVIKPGDSAQSPIVQRPLLPLDSDDHMPPAGKPQLTEDEIALLKWWVDTGASEEKTASELQPPPDIQKILSAISSGLGVSG
jgi:uncharacterized membrane protein/mono/diheme cytochrome c family protein